MTTNDSGKVYTKLLTGRISTSCFVAHQGALSDGIEVPATPRRAFYAVFVRKPFALTRNKT